MAVASSRVYCVELTRVSVTAAITLIQIKAAASVPLQILRAEVNQSSSTTSTQQPVQLNRKSAAATVTAFTPILQGPVNTDPAASAVGGTSATGTNASAEGTDTTIVRQGVFNYLQGWLYLPTPKEYLFVDGGGIVGLKLPVAPGAAVTLTADVVLEELG